MEELIKKIQKAVDNNGGEITTFELDMESPSIKWDDYNIEMSVSAFYPTYAKALLVVKGISLAERIIITYKKIPQEVLEQVVKAIEKLELIVKIKKLVDQKKSGYYPIMAEQGVELTDIVLFKEEDRAKKTSKDIVLFVHSLMVEVYDLDGEITKSVGRNLMMQYLELDYETLKEIHMKLEEM